VVVDGGSADGTKGAARRAGARVLTSLRGRGRQMNVGAVAAGARDDGDSLLVFLHADSSLPSGYGETIEREMCGGRSRRDWGAFAFKMTEAADGDSWAGGMIRRAIEFGTNCRCKLFGTPYGDQGLVIRRRAFDDVGGFEELPFMEDYVMVQKLRRRSAPRLFRDPVVTSGRRWDERGLAKVTLLNQVILMGYHLGVPVERLAKWYQFNF
jgi:rSAM/selenodomain-associated transferase 2